MGVEQPCHLHRQGAATGDHAPAAEVEPGRAGQGQGVHAGVLVEPAVFIGEQGFQVIGRYLVLADGITPYAIGIGEAPERRAVFGQHHPRQVVTRQRQREQAVGRPEQRQRQQRYQQQGPAQDAPGAARPYPRHPGGYRVDLGVPGHVFSRAGPNQGADGRPIRVSLQVAVLRERAVITPSVKFPTPNHRSS
ncbi:hypothetical protein D9M68_679530 [compost metagenome]